MNTKTDVTAFSGIQVQYCVDRDHSPAGMTVPSTVEAETTSDGGSSPSETGGAFSTPEGLSSAGSTTRSRPSSGPSNTGSEYSLFYVFSYPHACPTAVHQSLHSHVYLMSTFQWPPSLFLTTIPSIINTLQLPSLPQSPRPPPPRPPIPPPAATLFPQPPKRASPSAPSSAYSSPFLLPSFCSAAASAQTRPQPQTTPLPILLTPRRLWPLPPPLLTPLHQPRR